MSTKKTTSSVLGKLHLEFDEWFVKNEKKLRKFYHLDGRSNYYQFAQLVFGFGIEKTFNFINNFQGKQNEKNR